MRKVFDLILTGMLAAILIFVMFSPKTGRNDVQAAATYPPRNGDPCTLNVRQVAPISLTASGKLVTGATGKYTYICHISLDTVAAQSAALVEGTGTVCATNTAGMEGGATAVTGWSLNVNQMVNEGSSNAWYNATATAGDDVCLLMSGTAQISGVVQYVQQ